MATVSVDVDIDIDEFDLDELLDELENRYKRNDKKEIEDFISGMKYLDIPKKQMTLLDEIKIDFFMANIDRIKLQDLENLI